MRIVISSIAAFLFFATAFLCKAQDMPPTTSLVYPGITPRSLYLAQLKERKGMEGINTCAHFLVFAITIPSRHWIIGMDILNGKNMISPPVKNLK